MKLSKVLLGAILIGITVQTTSCKKEEASPKPDAKKDNSVPYDCPACGMG